MKCLLLLAKILLLIESIKAGCSDYGYEPCSFVPAPPGHTPPCAKPGMTYCEELPHYPEHLIHYLLDKWRFNHKTLLMDETKYDYSYSSAYPYPAAPDYKYVRNSISDSYYPDSIYPKPPPSHAYQGNSYIPPPPQPSPINHQNHQHNHSDGFHGYPDRRAPPYPPSGNGYKYAPPPHASNRPSVYTAMRQPPASAASYNTRNEWFPRYRYSRDSRKYLRRKRSGADIDEVDDGNPFAFNETSTAGRSRKKRQTNGQSLCPTRASFIMPKAALNNKGNWMYVVNMEDTQYTQLVKSEVCASQTCSNLCGIPNGFTARCEQKYVQKRLIALEGSGGQLYTDVFWFPSCCVCTVSN